MKAKKSLLLLSAILFICNSVHSQNFIWMNSFGGSSYENLYTAVIDKNDNIYITGAFQDSIDADPSVDEFIMVSSNYYDAYMVKLNSDGELIHAHSFGGRGSEFPSVIYVDDNLNYYVSGNFSHTIDVDPGEDSLIYTTTNYSPDIFFQKFNSNNQLQWAFHMVTHDEDDELNEIVVDNEGNVYCTGTFYGTMDFDPGEMVYELTSSGRNDIFIMKMDTEGNLLWAYNIGGWYEDYGNNILINNLGDLIISGCYKGVVDFDPGPDSTILESKGVYDAFFLKFTLNGDFIWVKTIEGGANDYISKIITDEEDNIIAAGSFRFSTDFNPDPDVEYIVEGGMWNDLYLLKLDKDGIFRWVNTLGNNSALYLHTIDSDSANNIYFATNFDEPTDIISGDSNFVVEPAGQDDFFIEKINPNGDYEWSVVMGSEYFEFVKTVVLDSELNVFTVGIFKDSPEYYLGDTSISITSEGSMDIFIQKINQEEMQVQDTNYIAVNNGFELYVFPNPSNGNFTITSSNFVSGSYTLIVIDSRGVPIFEKNILNNGVLHELVNIERSGVYLIKLTDSKNLIKTSKVIVNIE